MSADVPLVVEYAIASSDEQPKEMGHLRFYLAPKVCRALLLPLATARSDSFVWVRESSQIEEEGGADEKKDAKDE